MENGLPFLEQITGFLTSIPDAAMLVIVGIVDFAMRLVKTEKPKSIAWGLVKIMEQLCAMFGAVASFLDKILPQQMVQTIEAPKKKKK